MMSPKRHKGPSQPSKRNKQAKSNLKKNAQERLEKQQALESQEFTEEKSVGVPALPGEDSEHPTINISECVPKNQISNTEEDSENGDPVSDENQSYDIADYFPDENLPDLVIEKKPAEEIAPGRRIVNLQYVLAQMKQMASHSQKCTNGDFQLVKERRDGLMSSLEYQCFSCGRQETLTTEKVGAKADINDSMVWGAMSVGIGHHHSQEMFAALEIPMMSNKKWVKSKEHVQNIVDPRNLRDVRVMDPESIAATQIRKGKCKATGGQKKLPKKQRLDQGTSS